MAALGTVRLKVSCDRMRALVAMWDGGAMAICGRHPLSLAASLVHRNAFQFPRFSWSLMLEASSPNRLTIKKGGVTMQAQRSDLEARLSALEAYVELPEERTGMTITSRLKAQHDLLVALRADVSDNSRRLTGVEDRLTGVENRLTGVENRLSSVEDVLGQVLHGMTAIKNLLTHRDGPAPHFRANGSAPEPG
ncbi:MAG TPA: hypothetical protein VF069_06885 [Streptosporangiaceae bacterium]